jgi:hypothetical protein
MILFCRLDRQNDEATISLKELFKESFYYLINTAGELGILPGDLANP